MPESAFNILPDVFITVSRGSFIKLLFSEKDSRYIIIVILLCEGGFLLFIDPSDFDFLIVGVLFLQFLNCSLCLDAVRTHRQIKQKCSLFFRHLGIGMVHNA